MRKSWRCRPTRLLLLHAVQLSSLCICNGRHICSFMLYRTLFSMHSQWEAHLNSWSVFYEAQNAHCTRFWFGSQAVFWSSNAFPLVSLKQDSRQASDDGPGRQNQEWIDSSNWSITSSLRPMRFAGSPLGCCGGLPLFFLRIGGCPSFLGRPGPRLPCTSIPAPLKPANLHQWPLGDDLRSRKPCKPPEDCFTSHFTESIGFVGPDLVRRLIVERFPD